MRDGSGQRAVQFVDVRGSRLRVSVRGRGRPLLLVMGIGGNIEMWEPFEEALDGHGFQTIAFDAPGAGESSLPPGPQRMPGLARTVLALLDALGYQQVDVLGVSFGGAVAQQLARVGGDRVRRLVLAATLAGIGGGLPGHPRAMAILMSPRRYYSQEYLERVAPMLYGGHIQRNRGLMAQQAHARMGHPPSPLGYVSQLYTIWGWSAVPWLRHLHQPTLVLSGSDDPIIPVVNGWVLANLIPNARLEVLEDSGHLFLLEEAERVAPLVARFLLDGDPSTNGQRGGHT